MEAKIDKLLIDISDLAKKIEGKRTPWWERLFWAVEKMLIPLAVAALAFYGHSAATKISEGQLALAKSGAEDRREEFRRTMQSKYLELFYADISSGDQKRQSNALGLLRLMEPSLASDLNQLVQASPAVPSSIKAEAESAKQQIQAESQRIANSPSGPLAGYVVGIYFIATDIPSKKTADAVQKHLLAQGLGATVRLYPRDAEFMESVVAPRGLEVRYEEGVEDRQANVLLEALSKPTLNRPARPQLVGNTTPRFLSIFVPNGG